MFGLLLKVRDVFSLFLILLLYSNVYTERNFLLVFFVFVVRMFLGVVVFVLYFVLFSFVCLLFKKFSVCVGLFVCFWGWGSSPSFSVIS